MAGPLPLRDPLDPEGLWESGRGEPCCCMVGSYAVPVSITMSKLSVEMPGVSAGLGGYSWGNGIPAQNPKMRLIPSLPLVLSTKERR